MLKDTAVKLLLYFFIVGLSWPGCACVPGPSKLHALVELIAEGQPPGAIVPPVPRYNGVVAFLVDHPTPWSTHPSCRPEAKGKRCCTRGCAVPPHSPDFREASRNNAARWVQKASLEPYIKIVDRFHHCVPAVTSSNRPSIPTRPVLPRACSNILDRSIYC